MSEKRQAPQTPEKDRKGPEGSPKKKANKEKRLANRIKRNREFLKRKSGNEVDPERVLKKIGNGREKYSGEKRWKNATEPVSKFRHLHKGRELTPEAKAWANKHPKEVKKRQDELNEKSTEGGKKLSKRQETQNFRKAIVDTREKAGLSASKTLEDTRNSKEYQSALQDEFTKKQAENGGRPLTKREQVRAEEQFLSEQVKGKIDTQEQKIKDEAAKEAAAKETKENLDKNLRNSKEYKKNFMEELDKKTADGKELTQEDVEAAQKAALDKTKEDITKGDKYKEARAEILDKDPSKATDPNLNNEAMNKVIDSMKEEEQQKKNAEAATSNESKKDSTEKEQTFENIRDAIKDTEEKIAEEKDEKKKSLLMLFLQFLLGTLATIGMTTVEGGSAAIDVAEKELEESTKE